MSWWKRLMGGGEENRQTSRSVDFLAEALDLEKRGNYADALTSYRLALREKPDDLQVLQNMAIAFSRTAQPEEAIRSYRRALQIDPELAGAHYGLAYLLLKRGDTQHAAMHLEKFLRNSSGTDDRSAKFRAHAEQTLTELRNMAESPAEQARAQNAESHNANVHGDHANDLHRPEA